jgi:hypothetical protein
MPAAPSSSSARITCNEPAQNLGLGVIIGAAIGTIIDNQQ